MSTNRRKAVEVLEAERDRAVTVGEAKFYINEPADREALSDAIDVLRRLTETGVTEARARYLRKEGTIDELIAACQEPVERPAFIEGYMAGAQDYCDGPTPKARENAEGEWAARQRLKTNELKPLYIELSTFERQLMLAAGRDVSELVAESGWRIVRTKRERETRFGDSGDLGALYYECHVKIDGDFRPTIGVRDMGIASSRDLYRPDRWYVTMRREQPFDPIVFRQDVARNLASDDRACIVSHEYEACLLDTNTGLDKGWL